MPEQVECVVIGAGVIGLAIARQLAQSGREVLILERENQFGTQLSSRNSGVIHSGIYYPTQSLKASLCLRGSYVVSVLRTKKGGSFSLRKANRRHPRKPAWFIAAASVSSESEWGKGCRMAGKRCSE